MLLAFVVCSTIAVCIATPLHKYPYVFLLDIGNEELEKTNTEQLRVSIPGGSLVMKYPALGEGDPISHVRVSGIDFGTDLKVNIVEGGPGYKYVVLMFMGNPGINYDAVVTLQTLGTVSTSTELSLADTNSIASTENLINNSYEVTDADSDDNEQNVLKDPKNVNQHSKTSKEVMQSTSTFYNYAKSETGKQDEDKESENISAEEDDDNDEEESEDEGDAEEKAFTNNVEQRFLHKGKVHPLTEEEHEASNEDENESEVDESVQEKIYSEQSYDQFSDTPRAEPYMYNVNINNEDNAKPESMHDKYQGLKAHYGLGFRVYPQSFIYNRQYQSNSGYNKKAPVEYEQMYNDGEVPNDSRFKDGSNSIDSDYVIAEY